MGTEILQRQSTATSLEPAARRGRDRRPIWPFVATGLAITAVVVAGAAVLLQREAVPYQADASAITNSLAGIREQGPYVVIPQPTFGTADVSTTETREGGTYGLPVAAEPGGSPTEMREGGTYGPEWSGASTETREGGTYGLESSGSAAEAREGGAYEETG